MNTTSLLVKEHYLIEQVLNCLERMLERCDSQHKLERGPAQNAIVFLRGFTARCHYGRVETQLLPAMQAMDISPERCGGCSMHHRREKSESHLDAMEAAIEPASAGDAAALREFTEHARAYIELLLEYIAVQEDCVFPMIAQTLGEADKAELRKTLPTAGGDPEPNCACNTYIDVANRLADDFDVPRAVIVGTPGNRSLKNRSNESDKS
jgi:hemerythrin-like domain-containing protein